MGYEMKSRLVLRIFCALLDSFLFLLIHSVYFVLQTALGAFTSTSDVVVVCDGTCWPFQSPPQIANQSAALSNWLLYRTSVPYLQFHFVAISTVSASGSISGTKSVESK